MTTRTLIQTVATAVACCVVASGCAGDASDTREILDNLVQAGFASDDIAVVGGIVYVGRDAEVSLAASREMLDVGAAGHEQYRTRNLVSTSLAKICIDGATFTGTFSTALDLAIENYNERSLTFTMARAPSTGCGATISAVIQPGAPGGSSGFPSGGLPFSTINIADGLTGYSVDTIEHVITHELGHAIGLRHADYFNRSISCGTGGDEGDAGVGAIFIPGTAPDAMVGGSIMNSCFRTVETGELTGGDITALTALYGSAHREDYVVVWNNGGLRQIATYIANANGAFQEYIQTSGTGSFIADSLGRDLGYFADVTGDGRKDYVVVWSSGGLRQLTTFAATVNGMFVPGVTTSSAGSFTADSTGRDTGYFADVNGDGRQDYVVVWNNGGLRQLATYLANANGTFQTYVNTSSTISFLADSTGRDLGAFADVNGDGRQDYVAVWNSGGLRQLATYVANANGTFQAYVNTSSAGSFTADSTGRDTGYFADVTGDGRQDYVVVWNNGGLRQLATYVANANGTFQTYVNTSSTGSFTPDTTGRDTGYFADVTGDGRQDYVVAWNSGGLRQLATYVSNANGTFQAHVNTPSAGAFIPDSTGRDKGYPADVTGDGRADYVVVWNSGGLRQLATYVANANGTFQAYVNTPSAGGYVADSLGRDLGRFADVTSP